MANEVISHGFREARRFQSGNQSVGLPESVGDRFGFLFALS
jgi:hypothetical protein